MTVYKTQNGTALTIMPTGRIDAVTAPHFEQEVKESLPGITDVTFDFGKLNYISSAGLRVLILTHQTMNEQGTMKIINVNDSIRKVLKMTGITAVMNVE